MTHTGWREWAGIAAGIGAICGLATTAAAQSTGLVVESVKDYTLLDPTGKSDIDGAHTEADGLWVPLTAPGTGYTGTHRYKDNSVWDTDFYDPQFNVSSYDNDTANFDAPGTAISYVIAHGECNDVSTIVCSSDADCGVFGYCPGQPLYAGQSKVCIALGAESMIVSSTSSKHSNRVEYGSDIFHTFKSFGLGESSSSGSWAGIGTNGGSNVVFIMNSCGLRSRYWQLSTAHFHAGVHSVAMAMPVGAWKNPSGTVCPKPPCTYDFSDTINDVSRGAYIANAILTNIFSSVHDAWLNPTLANGYKAYRSTGYATGVNVLLSRDYSQAYADWHVYTESWFGAHNDYYDAKGAAYSRMAYFCNYNCAYYGM
ncbi:MAG: hypothetical protein R3B13_38995 [Polyangiaceae bacterium]